LESLLEGDKDGGRHIVIKPTKQRVPHDTKLFEDFTTIDF
jgi:hypothetical protein